MHFQLLEPFIYPQDWILAPKIRTKSLCSHEVWGPSCLFILKGFWMKQLQLKLFCLPVAGPDSLVCRFYKPFQVWVLFLLWWNLETFWNQIHLLAPFTSSQCSCIHMRVCVFVFPWWRQWGHAGQKQHLVSNRHVSSLKVPSVLQRTHGRNWTHKSLWLSHLDEQCSLCLWGGGENVVMKTNRHKNTSRTQDG